jgi:arylsulfate sulfotransferase
LDRLASLFLRIGLALVSLSAAACAAAPPAFVVEPTLTLGVVPAAPLSGELVVHVDRPVHLSVVTHAGTESWRHDYEGLHADWDVPVLRFLPSTDHRVDVVVTDEGGASTTATLSVHAPDVGAQFPRFSVVTRDAARQEPGFVVFAVPPVTRGAPSDVVALDDQGRVVWYYESDVPIADAVPYDDGSVLLDVGRTRAETIDMLGRRTASIHTRLDTGTPAGSTPLDTDTIHHELARLPDGTYVALSSELRAVDGFPTSVTDPTPRTTTSNVVAEIVVHFASDGTILAQLPLFDVIPHWRIGYDSYGSFWDATYPSATPTIDFVHGNSATIDRDTGNFVFSMRHQDAVMEVTPAGEVVWLLGDPSGWPSPIGDQVLVPVGTGFEYPYAMHAIEQLPNGHWLLFDNGVGRAIPPTPQIATDMRYSRGVEYEIDATAGTVREVWSYGRERGLELYASIVGDVDVLPTTGNVLITFGGILPGDEGTPAAHLVEVTHTTPAEVVFEVTLDDDNPAGPASRIIYRSQHVASLYAAGL